MGDGRNVVIFWGVWPAYLSVGTRRSGKAKRSVLSEILCPHCKTKTLDTWYTIYGLGSRLERLKGFEKLPFGLDGAKRTQHTLPWEINDEENSFAWEAVEIWSSSGVSGLRTFWPCFGTAFSGLGADGVEQHREAS